MKQIIYNLTIDLFGLALLVLGGFVVGETLIPGLLAAYVPTAALLLVTVAIGALVLLISHSWQFPLPQQKLRRIIAIPLLLIATALVLVSGIRFGAGALIIIAILTAGIGYLFYTTLFEK